MRIFLSHSSHYKPLLREVRRHLPAHVDAWVDEDRLLIGDDLDASLESAISSESDFVVLFIDAAAARSVWVKREIEWALSAEQRLGRTFVLPIVLDHDAWMTFEPAELRKRKFLSNHDFTEAGIKTLADELGDALFAWLSRDLERSRAHADMDDSSDVLGEADRFLRSIAAEIQTIVHPHRSQNPLEVESLYRRLSGLNKVANLNQDQFVELLARLERQNLLVGLNFDGDEIYVEEEHYAWKQTSFTDAKKRISRAAVREVRSGDVVALDAGSTTESIANRLAQGLQLHRLRDLTVVTNSLPAAQVLLTAAAELGLSDDSRALQVYLAGGRIRLNTLAVVASGENAGDELRRYLHLTEGSDIAFVGTNGICSDGFTTETKEESQTKQALLASARRRVVVTDPSKFGIRQREVFSTFEDVTVITTPDGYEEVLQEYASLAQEKGGGITLA